MLQHNTHESWQQLHGSGAMCIYMYIVSEPHLRDRHKLGVVISQEDQKLEQKWDQVLAIADHTSLHECHQLQH